MFCKYGVSTVMSTKLFRNFFIRKKFYVSAHFEKLLADKKITDELRKEINDILPKVIVLTTV